MIILRRLSPGPTVPELMRAERAAWANARCRTERGQMWREPVRAARCGAYLSCAALLVLAARILLRADLITPDCAVSVLPLVTRLTGAAVLMSRQ